MRGILGKGLVLALLAMSACAPHVPRAKAVLALNGDPARGRALYAQTCARCHSGGGEAWRWTLRIYGDDGVVSTLIVGVPHTRMPSFAAWSDQQIADVHAYLRRAGQ
jgi:mono/diheme cytochrome c family protein